MFCSFVVNRLIIGMRLKRWSAVRRRKSAWIPPIYLLTCPPTINYNWQTETRKLARQSLNKIQGNVPVLPASSFHYFPARFLYHMMGLSRSIEYIKVLVLRPAPPFFATIAPNTVFLPLHITAGCYALRIHTLTNPCPTSVPFPPPDYPTSIIIFLSENDQFPLS